MLTFDMASGYCKTIIDPMAPEPETEKLSDNEIAFLSKVKKCISKVNFLKDRDKKSIAEFVKEDFPLPEHYDFVLSIAMVMFPGRNCFEQLNGCDIKKGLLEEKTHCAVTSLVMAGEDYIKVKRKFKLDDDYKNPSNLPEVYGKKDAAMEKLRKENEIRKFFCQFPYASVIEASKTLKISNKEIRKHINLMEQHGEKVKYSNALRSLDFEDLKRQIIEIKRDNPAISDRELSYELEATPSEVRRAIQEIVTVMKLENAANYEFLVMHTVEDLGRVEKAAWERFKAVPNSSTEWLKIILESKRDIAKMLGLNAPEKLDVRQDIQITSKEERDAIVEAYLADESLDVDFKRIAVTADSDNNSCNGEDEWE